ncbi:hypothetical protein IQ64_04350 [Streptomyces stelliscabiei]|nr:hypothetical protein IQ64_04350 [Streptomyces stelliscabiei]
MPGRITRGERSSGSGVTTPNSVAIASNERFSGWTKTFADPRLGAGIVDRLSVGGNLIQTGTDSYRLAIAQARTAARNAAG